MIKRHFLRAAAAAVLPFVASLSYAQADFPNKPVRFIVGYAAGGPTDVIARMVAQEISGPLGQSVVVENRAGANGNIATEFVATSPADGYTLIVNTLSHNVNAILGAGRVKYDPEKDFAPISLAVVLPQYLVVGYNSPYKNVADLIARAKSQPGRVSYGSAGNGGSAHLAAALLAVQSNTEMIHVPFKGNAPAMTEVMAGRVDFMFYPMIGVAEREAQKQLRILAVTTAKRHPDTPNVPTTAEAGFPGFEDYVGPVGFMAPAGTPAPVLDKLVGAIRDALKKPAVQQRLQQLGAVPVASTPAEYREWLKKDYGRWSQLIKLAQIKE
jgi:tripartite-type tricarboxylate transporter receptor subunit TctC